MHHTYVNCHSSNDAVIKEILGSRESGGCNAAFADASVIVKLTSEYINTAEMDKHGKR